ncbi:hypothetical protein C0995_011630, partial [Termitomyces sp. Mi166
MCNSSDDKTLPTYIDEASNLMRTVLTGSGLPSSDVNSEGALRRSNLATIPVATESSSLVPLDGGAPITKNQFEICSTITPTISPLVALELASLINPSASLTDTKLQVYHSTGTPDESLSVPSELSGVSLAAAPEVSTIISAAVDISNTLVNVSSLTTESVQASVTGHLSITHEVSPTKGGDLGGVTSDFLQSKLDLGDLAKIGGVVINNSFLVGAADSWDGAYKRGDPSLTVREENSMVSSIHTFVPSNGGTSHDPRCITFHHG